MSDDEGPSEADIERFGDVTQTCPACSAELYDDAEMCWKCGHAFASGASRPMPKWVFVSVGAVLAAFVAVLLIR